MRPAPFASALVAITILGPIAPAFADDGACDAFKWSIAAERQLLTSPGIPSAPSGGTIAAPGQGVAVTLVPESGVSYPVKPARPPKANPSYGALITLDGITKAQTVQITLSDEAWVDLVQGGKVIRSSGFSGKPGCPGVRKSVRFAVAPGPVAIEISDTSVHTLKLAVEPVD